jgi:iron complex outermembrane recepter protein
MTSKFMRALAVTTALTSAFPAFAQDAQADGVEADAGEIIVTARRSDERLQDVPVSVQVVTGDSLQKLSITSADELSKVAPGLTLVNQGANTQVSLRGVSWRPGSGTPATPIYFNEIGFSPADTVQSLFDIGQIEVLRGPQGTSRGAPSISGAITITSRKPDLSEFGGFVQGLYGSANHWDIQAAVNLPVIKDMLAIRLATNIENSEGDRVYSVRTPVKPSVKDRSFRATVLFKPTDTLSIQAMYQRRKTDRAIFTQVQGTGSPGAPASATAFFGTLGAIPANFNGPALTLAQRASVQDAPSTDPQHVDLLSINASWEVFGQKLSYNFGRQFNRGGASFNASDPLNMLPGFENYTSPANVGLPKFRVHELRLSGDRVGGSPVSYDIGWYSKHSGGTINFNSPTYLAGAFGAPNALPGAVTTPNPAYVLNSSTNIAIGQVFDSFYGNLKFQIDDNTELAGGLAFIKDRVPVTLNISTFAARTSVSPYNVVILSVPAAFRPFFPTCESISPSLITSPAYQGVCDSPIPNGVGNSTQSNNDKYKSTLYNFSLSHKFSDDVMVYATTGSSFRTGLPAINNNGLPVALVTPLPEKAKSYEIGIKTTLAQNLRINAAVFQIDYGNQLTTFEGINYFNTVSNRIANTSLAFYRNVNSRVRGFELEVAAKPTDNLSLGANVSYSQIKSQGGTVPCNDPARPITPANPINFCPSSVGQVLNQDAPFNATFNGSYTVPLGSLEGYFRFNLNVKGNNPNFGNFAAAGVFKPTPSYAVLDLFAGIAGQDNIWDLGFFAKNVTNKQVELSRVATLNNVYGPYAVAPSGYNTVRTSLPREFGVSLRYAFGSR